jgi:predicted RNA-binding protein YlxR (DUF448 family)
MIKLKASDGWLVVMEQKETLNGRGCYVCPTLECVEKARKKRKLQKALKSEFQSMPSVESILNKGVEKKGCADDHHDR